MPLNSLKKDLPLETAEFTVCRRIDDEPSFKSWVPCTIFCRDIIIDGVNKKEIRVTQKYGVELPTSVSHAKRLE